jgi:hypothetical protein
MSNSGKVKCTCGWSWNKSDSSKKDMYVCHECGRDNSNNMENGGWLDNYNDSETSVPEGYVGEGYSTKGRNYSPAWGGQFQMGGSVYPVNYVPKAQWGLPVGPLTPLALSAANKVKSWWNDDEPVKPIKPIKPIKQPVVKKSGNKDNTRTLNISDPRKILATTNQPLRPNSDLVSGKYSSKHLDRLLQEAKRQGLSKKDMLDLSAMGFQETKWGKSDDNIGHVKGDWEGDDSYQQFISAYKEKMKLSDKLGIKDPALRLQVYNGLGTITPRTEKDYHGFEMQKIYGVPIPKGGINMKKNPLYGKQVMDIRDNVLAKNPEYVQYMDSIYKAPVPAYMQDVRMNKQKPPRFIIPPLGKKEMGGSIPQAQDGKLTFLQPTSDKLPQGYRIPYADPSSELAMSIGGENGEPAYLIPSFKYGKPLYNAIEEFKKTGEHLGGPFKTWQEADKWEQEVRHPYVEKGQDIPMPIKTWGEMAMGGSIPGSVGFTYARTNDPAPSNGPYAKKTKASAQNGETLQYGTPEYKKAYDENRVAYYDKDSDTYINQELAPIEVQGRVRDKGFWEQYVDKIVNENRGASPLEAAIGVPISAVASLPQLAATYAFTDKVQRPSEAMDIENPYLAMGTDFVLDPLNVTGTGVLTKERALARLAASKESGLLSKFKPKQNYMNTSEVFGSSDDLAKMTVKDVKPRATRFDAVTEVNPLSQAQAQNLAEQGRHAEIFKEFEVGANTIDDFVKSYTGDLSSPEGFKRLAQQEADYLRSIGFDEARIAKQAEINAGARLNEIINIGNTNRAISKGEKTADAVIGNNYNFNNASYTPNTQEGWVDDLFYQPGMQLGPFNLNKTRLGAKVLPGKTNLGTTFNSSKAVAAHEIGGHGLQSGRPLPVDSRLKKLEPLDELNEGTAQAYKYFMQGSSGKEPSAYLHELRQAMLDNKLIRNRYDYVSPEKLERAQTIFDLRPAGTVNAMGDKFHSDTRILDFMKPTKSNFDLLATELNKLPAMVPIGVAGAAGVLSQLEEVPVPGMKQGGVIKDDMGQWNHPGEITEIGSNQITMEGVPYDVLGISDTGDTKLMKPGKNYKFKGKKVTEYPMAKDGIRQEQKGLVNLDQLTNFTNYNTKQPGGWLDKY